MRNVDGERFTPHHRKRKRGGGEEGEGREEETKRIRLVEHLPSIRIPLRNCIPNYFVPKKIGDRRGKKRKKEEEEERNKQRNGVSIFLSGGDSHLSENSTSSHGTDYNLICSSCNNHDLSRFLEDTQGCPVCENCGTVQVSQVSFKDECWETPKRVSQAYQRRSYIGERLRQFSGTEPRIPEQDLEAIRYIYAELCKAFHSNHPLFTRSKNPRGSVSCPSSLFFPLKEKPPSDDRRVLRISESFTDRSEDLTKENVKNLLGFVDYVHSLRGGSGEAKTPVTHFKKKYLERWTQIKRYFCGDHYYSKYIAPKPSGCLLDYLYKMAILVARIYENKELLHGYILLPKTYPDVVEYEDEKFIENVKKRRREEEEEEGGCCGSSLNNCMDDAISTLEEILFGERIDLVPRILPTPKTLSSKENIPSLDLLFLMLLYAYENNSLEVHGWYFVKKIMHEYVFKLPGSSPCSLSSRPLEEILEEREKRREKKFLSLRVDFLVLKKILTHINKEFNKPLEEIATIPELPLKLPKSLSEILHIISSDPDYPFKEDEDNNKKEQKKIKR